MQNSVELLQAGRPNFVTPMGMVREGEPDLGRGGNEGEPDLGRGGNEGEPDLGRGGSEGEPD